MATTTKKQYFSVVAWHGNHCIQRFVQARDEIEVTDFMSGLFWEVTQCKRWKHDFAPVGTIDSPIITVN